MIRNYFKIAWRNLTKRKGFAFINIVGLALGFGCSILIFLFVSHHLQFDNFHNNSDRIYRIVTEEHRDDIDYEASVPPGFAHAFRTEYDYAEKVAKYVSRENQLIAITEGNQSKRIKEDIAYVEEDFFKIFNFPLVNSIDISLSEPNTTLITEEASKRIYGNENPIGKSFKLKDKETITIVGVLKNLPKTTVIKSDFFVSFVTLEKYDNFLSDDQEWSGINSALQCFALLHPNQNISQIETEIFGFVKKHRSYSKNVHHYKLQPLADIHFNANYYGGMDSKLLWIFSLIGLFLLVIASINFINISTAQSVYRSKEVGVRKVLGSFKGQLFWQFMTETFIITLLSLGFGVVLSVLTLPYFNTVFGLELSMAGAFNYSFLGFVLLLLVTVSLLAGSYPGIVLARIAPIMALKRKLTQKDAGGLMTRKVLVIIQFIISIMLIIGTLVINKQIKYAINSDLGFDKSAIVMVELPDESVAPLKLEGLKNRIAEFSGVEKITACFASPGSGDSQWGTSVVYNNKPEAEEFSIQTKIGDEDYLNTFDLKLVAGRNFYVKDSVDEILVNETFARKLGIQSPEELLGKSIQLSGDYVRGTIVGVIADFHDRDFHENISPIYIAPKAEAYNEFAIKINMNNSKESLNYIEEQWTELYPNFIFGYDFLDDRIAKEYETEQRFLSLTKLFSGLAIFIGCLGIYGLILFFVIQKTKEIGIRKVLGGTISHIVVLVMQDFLKLILVAGLIASPLAWYFMSEWLQSYTYKTELSWWIYVAAIGMVLVITVLTASYQAIKAARVNPVKSLRTE